MSTSIVFCPFDLFGSGGTAAGADLLGEAVDEMIADNRRERQPTRAQAYAGQLKVRRVVFETADDIAHWRPRGRQAARRALDRGDFLLWVGGNHLSVLPVFDELSRIASPGDGPGRRVLVVQLDAHLDVYNLSDCTAELSHGNFLLHCDRQLPPVINVGSRELLLPADHVGRSFVATYPASDFAVRPAHVLAGLRKAAADADLVFIDIDCDALDPAAFPGVTHPRPFGLPPWALLQVIDAIWSDRVAGLAISEFCPTKDRDDQSLGLLMWLIEYVLLKRYEPSA